MIFIENISMNKVPPSTTQGDY